MWIEQTLYEKIVEQMPIPTVDAIVLHKGTFLLLKRNNPPVKGEWWLPGGRVYKGETLEAAVKREVWEETGLKCTIIRQVGVINQIFTECHTISVYFIVESSSKNVTLSSEHSEYKWANALPQESHSYLQEMFKNAGLS